MKDPELAYKLVKATKEATSLPVSVKTRLGWEDKDNLLEFALGLEEAGAEILTIHGRTAKQAYRGKADWDPIYEIKEKVHIPVIGNGDIKSLQEGKNKIKNLDGFMIGRAAFGNPWVFSDKEPSLTEKIPLILKHCRYSIDFYGEKWGIISMRKHLLAYLKGFPGARDLRIKVQKVEDLKEVEELLLTQ